MVTFTSSSTVDNLFTILQKAGVAQPAALLAKAAIVCIGPLTADTARKYGLRVDAMAAEATIDSLVDTLSRL
ncbi:uroporphyrinogen-III synthase [compost metagenome]